MGYGGGFGGEGGAGVGKRCRQESRWVNVSPRERRATGVFFDNGTAPLTVVSVRGANICQGSRRIIARMKLKHRSYTVV